MSTIESVLQQTHVSTEIIVVDDSSTDSTQCVLEFYQSYVRTIRIPNSGPAAARNAGAILATGKWLAFLDADDIWEPEKLEQQLRAASVSGARVVYTNARNFGEDLPVDEIRLLHCPIGDVFEQLLLDNFITLSGLMVDRLLFFETGAFDEEIIGCEDWDLLLRMAEYHQFAAVDQPLVRYRWQSGSLSSNHQTMQKSRVATIAKALQSERGSLLSRWESRQVWSSLWQASAWTASFNSRMEARICALRSLLCWPSLKALKQLLAP